MELYRLSGASLGREIRSGNITPTEVIEYFGRIIEKQNPGINAFVYTKIDEALAEAKKLEERLYRKEEVGPLAGVPVGLKDFLPSKKGWTNSHGGVRSLIRTDVEDSEFYKAASKLGCIAIGKTNAPAFAFRGTCDNKLYGPTRNPFNRDYNSGGSSGGSAAAVAAGLIPIAQGTDGGGSLRIPASWCNCFGFKASVGTVPSVCRPDGWTATHPFCCDGAITRTIEDGAIILNMMAHYDAKDPYSLPHPERDFTKLMERPVKDWKIAFTPDFDIFPVDPKIESIVTKAAYKLEEAGAHVDRVRFNFTHSAEDFAHLWCKCISVDTSIDLELWKREGLDMVKDHRDELPEEFIYWNRKAFDTNVMEYRYINELRTEILDCFEKVFEDYDIIVSPVTICPPVKNTEDGNTKGPESVNGIKTEPLIGFCETLLVNFLGNPAASVPAGFTDEGLPTGIHIIGKKFKDEDVFAVARTLEQISPWNYDTCLDRI